MLPARCSEINLAMLLVPPPGSEMRDGIVSRRTWEEKVKFDADDYNNNRDGLIMIINHKDHAPCRDPRSAYATFH